MNRGGGSSHRWRQRQLRDPFVERATREGWRSRAAFKLLEIDQRERLLRPGICVVDLGAAPGGWAQVATRRVGSAGRTIAIDRLSMDPIDGVEILQADFASPEGLAALRGLLQQQPADVVLSDLAPNISGNRAIDQPRSMALVEDALSFAREVLKPGGTFLTKVFQGEGQVELEQQLRREFGRVKRCKPKASRAGSREIYLLASDYGMV
jgi:23S rRNA (uridine2552-2'-O)-methyltransferase